MKFKKPTATGMEGMITKKFFGKKKSKKNLKAKMAQKQN